MSDTVSPAVGANFKDTDPTKAHEWESATVDQLLTEAPSWSGPDKPGSFPDYDDDDAYAPNVVFPPPESLQDALIDNTIHTGFGEHPTTPQAAPGEQVGRPSRVYTSADVTNLAVAALQPTRLLVQGDGILYGYTAFSVATVVTPFTVITDSLDGNGPVLMVIANGVVQSGFVSAGRYGIEFRTGLSLANLTTLPGTPGAQLALIPIIRRIRPKTYTA